MGEHETDEHPELVWRRHRRDNLVHGFHAGKIGHYSSTALCRATPLPMDLEDPVPVDSVPDGGLCRQCLIKHGEELAGRSSRSEVAAGEMFPTSRLSIPPVDPNVASLAGQLVTLALACEEVAAYLPVGRMAWDRLAEFADMLEAVTPEVRSLVERMVVDGPPQERTADESG